MTDPLSITFGVVGTAGVALHAVHKLYSFIESIDGAPTAINSLTNDLHALHNVLQTLEATVTDSNITDLESRARILKLLEEPLRNCVGIADAISTKLTPFVKLGGKAKKSKWRGFVWTFRENEFTDLKALLLSYKTSLEIALSAANLTNNVAGFSDLQFRIRKLQRKIDIDNASIADSSATGSSPTQTVYGFALKRFLLETETAFSELPPSPVDQPLAVSEFDVNAAASKTSEGEPLRSREPPFTVHRKRSESLQAVDDFNSEYKDPRPKSTPLYKTASSPLYPCIEGCIMPDLVAAIEYSLGPATRIAELHLFGIRAHALMVPYPKQVSKFDEALHDFKVPEAGELGFRRGDIIRRGIPEYQDWCTGYLAEKSGLYPKNYVRPCTFNLTRLSPLGDALQGRPLLDETASEAFFIVTHNRPRPVPTSHYWKTIGELPSETMKLLNVLIKSLRHMDRIRQLPWLLEDQMEAWSRIIFSDIYVVSYHWKQKALEDIIKDRKILDFLKSPGAMTTTIPTLGPSPPVTVHTGMNLDVVCATEGNTVPNLVSRAIRTIELDLRRNPVYVGLWEADENLDSVLKYADTAEERYRVLLEKAEDTNMSAMALLVFFKILDQPILTLSDSMEASFQRLNQNDRATLKVLVDHLGHVSAPQNRSVNNHNDASLTRIWTPVLTGAKPLDLQSELLIEQLFYKIADL